MFEAFMNHPKVIFEDTPELRSQYLAYLAKQIACGYYQDRRFLVLPRLVEKDPRTIYFPASPAGGPDLKYPKELWRALSKYTSDDFDYFFPEKIIKLIPDSQEVLLRSKKSSFLETEWRAKEKQFFDCVAEFLPKFNLQRINFIKVLPVEFGTVGSFYFSRSRNEGKTGASVSKNASTVFEHKKDKYNFYHTIRTDFGAAQLAETILTSILKTKQTTQKLTDWYHRENIVDFLMTESKLGEIFDYDYQPTVSKLPEISENLVQESEKYLVKLGFPVKPILAVDSGYTPTEKRILEHFIANKNQLITYDEIGDLFWGEDLDKFSLASIAKIMEKIRKKIKDHGIYQELIFTIRGQGYVLYD